MPVLNYALVRKVAMIPSGFPPLALVSSLIAFLEVEEANLCCLAEDENMSAVMDMVAEPLKDILVKVAVTEEIQEVADGVKTLKIVPVWGVPSRREFYKADSSWLVYDFLDSTILDQLPLRLDSNVMSLSNQQGVFLVQEWYKVLNGQLLSSHYASWSPAEGLVVPVPFKWQRRKDLRGTQLSNAIVENWIPVGMLHGDSETGLSMAGLFPDVLQELQSNLNFTTSLTLVEDLEYGTKRENGTWTGAVGLLQDGAINITTTGLTISLDRSFAIDFTTPVLEDGSTLIVR